MADDFRLQEECQQLQDTASYVIENEHDVRSMDHGEVTALLEGSSGGLVECSPVSDLNCRCC